RARRGDDGMAEGERVAVALGDEHGAVAGPLRRRGDLPDPHRRQAAVGGDREAELRHGPAPSGGTAAARCCLSSRLSTLRAVGRGSGPVSWALLGHWKGARRSRHQAMISSADAALPAAGVITACTASPQAGSGSPMTATSATAGWRASTASTSAGLMFSPPLMIMSLARSRM